MLIGFGNKWLFLVAGEPAPSFDMTSSYAYDEKNATTNGQHSTSATSDHASAVPSTEGNDLPGPKFYRTPSQAVVSVGGLDSVEGGKPHSTANIAAFGEAAPEVASAATTLSSGVPEPASPDVVIWSDSYEKALETRLSDSLKQRIRNIFLTPSERELRTLQMSDSSALSRGQQRCRVTTLDLGRKVSQRGCVLRIFIVSMSCILNFFRDLLLRRVLIPTNPSWNTRVTQC